MLDLISGAIRSSRGKFRRFRRVCLYTRKRLPRSGFVQTLLWEIKSDFREADFWPGITPVCRLLIPLLHPQRHREEPPHPGVDSVVGTEEQTQPSRERQTRAGRHLMVW